MRKKTGLESVLRWRRSLERAAELALKKSFTVVKEMKHELEEIAAERQRLRAGLNTKLREGAGAEVFRLYSPAALELIEDKVREKLRLAEVERLRAEIRYAECRRDRKVIENMLARRGAEERMEASRREQVRVDEATMRRATKQAIWT
jgi:flagellar export protein FliJ